MNPPTFIRNGALSNRRLATVLLAACFSASTPFLANSASEDAISFAEIASMEQEVIIPIPSEIFNVLDQFAIKRSDWRNELAIPKKRACKNRTHTALFLGSVVAEGFLAVQAQDSDAITELGRALLEVADSLGLRKVVIKHSKSIIDAAGKNDWQALREEFDATRVTVRAEMQRRRDQHLSQCVSVGGWVRGTEIVTAIIKGKYSAEKAEILHQPDLIKHFNTTFKAKGYFRKNPRMQALIEKLGQLEPLMAKDGNISKVDVAQIYQICNQLGKNTIAP